MNIAQRFINSVTILLNKKDICMIDDNHVCIL